MGQDEMLDASQAMQEAPESLLGEQSLQKILKSMLATIEDSKSQIFDVYESAREEVDRSKKTLEHIKRQTSEVIDEVDALEHLEQQEKQRLVRVSSSFNDYSEERIHQAYESVKTIQVQHGIARERERQLRRQRNQLELRLRHLQKTVVAAERLAMRISSMLNFLGSQLSDVVLQLEEASKSKFLSAAIIRAQEEERLRVSREIHDGPAQDVANLMIESSIVERLIDIDPDDAKMNIQELRRHLKDCLTSIRQIIFDLRPMSLDDLGLPAALDQLARQFRQREHLDLTMDVEGTERPLEPHVKSALFRIVQEGMNNIVHHAGAKTATLRLLYTESALSVLLEDKGQGFDPEAMPQADPEEMIAGHYGIIGMRERAAIIGAQFSLTSAPGKGTKVHVRVSFAPPVAPTLGETIEKVMGKSKVSEDEKK